MIVSVGFVLAALVLLGGVAYLFLRESTRNPAFAFMGLVIYEALSISVSVLFLVGHSVHITESNTVSFETSAFWRLLGYNLAMLLGAVVVTRRGGQIRRVRPGRRSVHLAMLIVTCVLLLQAANLAFSSSLPLAGAQATRWTFWTEFAAMPILRHTFGILMMFVPFVCGLVYLSTRQGWHGKGESQWAIGALLAYIVYLVLTGQRFHGFLPAASVLLGLYFAYRRQGEVLPWRRILVLGGCLATLLLIYGVLALQYRGIASYAGGALQGLAYRVLVLQGHSYWNMDALILQEGPQGNLGDFLHGMETLLGAIASEGVFIAYSLRGINMVGGVPSIAAYVLGFWGAIPFMFLYGVLAGWIARRCYVCVREGQVLIAFPMAYLWLWTSSVYAQASLESVVDIKYAIAVIVVVVVQHRFAAPSRPRVSNRTARGALTVVFLLCLSKEASARPVGLQVPEESRVLVEQGDPVFYLADTAWLLLYKLDKADSRDYIETRSSQGFNAIHVIVAADDLRRTNASGAAPFHSRPNESPSWDTRRPNEPFFAHVDWLIQIASDNRMYVGLVPIWGSLVTRTHPVFDQEDAAGFGEFLGARYRRSPVVWILGGDQNGTSTQHVWRAFARSIRAAGSTQPMTYHPRGGQSSATWFHHDQWLDFNMLQSGHSRRRPDYSPVEMILRATSRVPPKPVIDGESGYEDIPEFLADGGARLRDEDVRGRAYESVLSGALGYVYGANGVMQFTDGRGRQMQERYEPLPWRIAMTLAGAQQMTHLRTFFEEGGFEGYKPEAGIATDQAGRPIVAGFTHDGRRLAVYCRGAATVVRVDSTRLGSKNWQAAWFDPRSGNRTEIGAVEAGAVHFLSTPVNGLDWLLVLDEVGHTPTRSGVSRTVRS